MRVTVLVYGDGGERYLGDRRLLVESAIAFGADRVIECDRSALNSRFRTLHSNTLAQTRGDGYWLWKPFIVDSVLSDLQDGEVLFYIDADQRFCRPIKDACETALSRQPVFFRELPTQYLERHWTKADSFYYFGVMGRADIADTPQFEAGRIIMVASPATRALMRSWLAACCAGALITDEPSRIENLPGFIEHRHDQSLFSIGAKIASLGSFDDSEEFWRTLVKSDDVRTFCL